MLRYCFLILFLTLSAKVSAFEILALGTSDTNCKGGDQFYTKTLNNLLTENKIDAEVINAGKDGDTPFFMLNRLKSSINEKTKIVIFEPGPNDRNKTANLKDTDKILKFLNEKNIKIIYVSNSIIENELEGFERAKKFNAYYYGNAARVIPKTRKYFAYDTLPGEYGHMTKEGCIFWAEMMYRLIETIISEKNSQN